MRHWTNLPNTSRLFLRAWKCLDGLREGGMRFAMANLPSLGVFLHSCCQSLRQDRLARRLAFERETLNGTCRSRVVASFASSSALSFPGMPQWLGHQAIEIERFSLASRIGLRIWWNLIVKYWAELGLGLLMALTAAALSEKIAM